MDDDLERVRIARRMYAMHPNRDALAERLGLSPHDVAQLEAETGEQDPDTIEPRCGHLWQLHSVDAGGCESRGCPCLVMPGGRR
jgi:hypothetical protein